MSPCTNPFLRPAVLGALLAAMALPAGASAASVAPEHYVDNPKCEELGAGWTSILKDDGANGGHFSENGYDIDIDINGLSFDWTSSKAVDAVIVKGGEDGNVYKYVPGSLGDTDLVAPVNPNNQTTFGLSHIEFCDGPDAPPPPDPDPDPDPDPQPDPDPDPPSGTEPTPDPDPKPDPKPGTPDVPAINVTVPQPGPLPQAGPITPAGKAAAKSQSAPTARIAAASRLAAPRSCVTRTFRVAVKGRGMRSVTFFVNGRKVATKKGRRNVSVLIPVTSDVHRIRAKVRYVNGATRTTKTLRASALRCLQRVVRPQFTG
ncbi:MAG TPA: hypothetical protein VF587_03665 [Solirubrobacteraceae bacterium]|jgi:hypothetical protein